MNYLQQIWNFFASVQLAICTLCCISLTSIIGTVVPQGETSAEYVRRFGEKTALFFHILDIPRMYSSWWFHGLLALLAVNLIVCSLDRFPAAWKLINADNLDISPSRLEKMPLSRRWTVSTGLLETIDWHRALSSRSGGVLEKNEENRMLLLAEKGKWSRLGVYLVHASILIIFVGAIVGQLWGFKGSVMLPELRETGHVFSVGNSDRIPLGFTVRCQAFAIDYYDNGMVKEYRSTLTILEDQKEVLTTDIIVNSPLEYRGITFYQSSYQPHQEFIVEIHEAGDQAPRRFTVPFQQEGVWAERGLRFGILNAEGSGQRSVRAKLWFKAGEAEAVNQWLDDNQTVTLETEGKTYTVRVKQLYSTGLQVAKDPGVWIVYGGCFFLLFGLYLAFFHSHQKIWISIEKKGHEGTVVLAGTTNKNKLAFARRFQHFGVHLDSQLGPGADGKLSA